MDPHELGGERKKYSSYFQQGKGCPGPAIVCCKGGKEEGISQKRKERDRSHRKHLASYRWEGGRRASSSESPGEKGKEEGGHAAGRSHVRLCSKQRKGKMHPYRGNHRRHGEAVQGGKRKRKTGGGGKEKGRLFMDYDIDLHCIREKKKRPLPRPVEEGKKEPRRPWTNLRGTIHLRGRGKRKKRGRGGGKIRLLFVQKREGGGNLVFAVRRNLPDLITICRQKEKKKKRGGRNSCAFYCETKKKKAPASYGLDSQGRTLIPWGKKNQLIHLQKRQPPRRERKKLPEKKDP